MISRNFVKLWEPQYDTLKYPEDFYLRFSDSARKTEQPEQLKEDLLALLHWKDGKAVGFVPGKNNAKPNTLNPILSLRNTALTNFWGIFKELAQADDKDVLPFQERLRERLMDMWNTVVIPAFLLNVARPDRLPIIDQHTVRAFLALTSGKVVEKPNITWNLWREYVTFFQNAVMAAGYDHNSEEGCYVDRALFAWGKSLKGKGKSQDIKIVPKINRPILWSPQIPKAGVIPPGRRRSKYSPLHDFLTAHKADRIELSYSQIEEIIGSSLPASSRKHSAQFWANHYGGTHVWATQWMEAGWKVDGHSISAERVVFVRAVSATKAQLR